jgi:hypothetical protein
MSNLVLSSSIPTALAARKASDEVRIRTANIQADYVASLISEAIAAGKKTATGEGPIEDLVLDHLDSLGYSTNLLSDNKWSIAWY